MTNYEIIKDAIINKKQITATLNEEYLKLCPHVLGTKGGYKKCLFFQFGGRSHKKFPIDEKENWRCIFVDSLDNVVPKKGEWHTTSNYSSFEIDCIDDIDVKYAL